MSPEEMTGAGAEGAGAPLPRVFVRADTPDAGENEAIKEAALSAGFTGLITSSDAAFRAKGTNCRSAAPPRRFR